MNKKLQVEIWEIQIILYWILAVLVHAFLDTGWLVGIIVAWSIISFIGMFVILIHVYYEEHPPKTGDTQK